VELSEYIVCNYPGRLHVAALSSVLRPRQHSIGYM